MAHAPKEPDHLSEIREAKRRERARTRQMKQRRQHDDDLERWDDGWGDGLEDIHLAEILQPKWRPEDE